MAPDQGNRDDCPFCRIAAGDASAYRVHETPDVVAFLDHNPAVRGHTLVVPKPHVDDLLTDEPALAEAVFAASRTVAAALDAVLDVDGHTLVHTSGHLVGTVQHAHLHVLPRRPDDGIGLSLARHPLDDAGAARLADRLAAEA